MKPTRQMIREVAIVIALALVVFSPGVVALLAR